MPIDPDLLKKNASYFVSDHSVVLRETKTGTGAVNHLLLSDWLKYLGETHTKNWTTKSGQPRSRTFAKVRCRGDTGWLDCDDFGEERGLEVNFVDVGQGDGCHIVTPDDEVLLVDAGVSDNMNRFLSWRYNLRSRNVEGAPDFDPDKGDKGPFEIDHVVMSHPDNDHYYGFLELFENAKFTFGPVYHNGIVERPAEEEQEGVDYKWDLGGLFTSDNDEQYLFDYITSPTKLKALVNRHPTTTKQLISTLRALFANTPGAKVHGVGVPMAKLDEEHFLPGFEKDKKFSLQLLGPIQEKPKFGTKTLTTVRRLGNEGETKNGHSVIFKAQYGKLRLLLGGDLNVRSQNFLLQSYSGKEQTLSDIHKEMKKLRKKKTLNEADQAKLEQLVSDEAEQLAVGNEVFGVDIAKACHHGSPHILDEFIAATDAAATVISSGDEESHVHPRPDALGAYGKHSRGIRPLIFSTELARSTREFSPFISSYVEVLLAIAAIEAETNKNKKASMIAELEDKRDRNVAVYGMITVRALGDKVILAQKLERSSKASRKWDIHELHYDDEAEQYYYDPH
ncbi:MAG: MBL fold metallo-hydrolase [Erythrobacter sp.]|nr:MBL fold metallo-hydrolase [Erythrobacter sp.]